MTIDVTYEATLKEVRTERGVLRYHEAGDGPPLLLLHGSGPGVTGWRNFRGNLGVFAEHFRTLVLEFPGFGVSDDFGGHPMVDALSAAVDFLDALDLQDVAVVGNSMGGMVGINMAIDHPERVNKLVTIGGIGKNIFSPGPGEGINLLMDFTDDPTRERLIAWLHSMVYDPALVTDELIEERWTQATEPGTLESARRMYSRAAFEAGMRAQAESDATPYWARMHKISAPVLLTWGRDDRVSPLDMSLLPMRTIPRAELHVFPQCGHWAMIEQKTAFDSAVLAFLRRKDTGAR
ncbi:alpha/beta fold hydrolase [Rhodococcus rhodnii]|uniref:Alpha/beta hydrolase n=2 Tax=Rhodococcus rhodnii TaxID=38312 RepID=R7WTK2_9NOCA|nr:alpha/beta fold hydrolase [Rhodococcus rhodnii]EOM77474.1 alpha/beta hydrolase [Rhodococcus rhodnii LMG 5362]TXG90349.1 alpha/beta fold hydrolase [Rhodococcus rhodnii]